MTERGHRHVQRQAHSFAIGSSLLAWNGQSLNIQINERASPLPRRVIGQVRVHPLGLSTFSTPLDAQAGRHRWGPIAPCARIEVNLDQPSLRWQGNAYLDSNEGDEPVDRGFQRWDWLRAPLDDGRCAVLYDVQPRHGPAELIGARFAPQGDVEPFTLQQRQRLPATRWFRVQRRVPVESAGAQVTQTLEDTPFYARSLLHMHLGGRPAPAVHETLNVGRLTSPVVQRMLPFRMARVA